MNDTNFENFMKVYAKHLGDARREYPTHYVWPEEMFSTVVERMKNAIYAGTFNKDGWAFKRTCKELGIKYTYSAISAYLER